MEKVQSQQFQMIELLCVTRLNSIFYVAIKQKTEV